MVLTLGYLVLLGSLRLLEGPPAYPGALLLGLVAVVLADLAWLLIRTDGGTR